MKYAELGRFQKLSFKSIKLENLKFCCLKDHGAKELGS